jgi:GNAT superfamily N-acetyltransferase
MVRLLLDKGKKTRSSRRMEGASMAAETLLASLDGITLLPPGHVATIKSYLERAIEPDEPAAPPLPQGLALHRLRGKEAPRYRALFQTIGSRWLWWSRLLLPADTLAVLLDDPAVEAFAVVEADRDIGLLEWDFSQAGRPELAFLGFVEGATGRGFGSLLMRITLARMAEAGASALRVNTCTFDHPAALAFYRRNGFTVVAQALEIVLDPRLHGLLPQDAAPHIPILPISASGS